MKPMAGLVAVFIRLDGTSRTLWHVSEQAIESIEDMLLT